MNQSNPKTHTCPTCGYVWDHGRHGGHNCSDLLLEQNKRLKVLIGERDNSINELTAQNANYEAFTTKIINWNEQFTPQQQIDIGRNGEVNHFVDLAKKLLGKTSSQSLSVGNLIQYLLSDEYLPLLERAILARYGTSYKNKDKHEKAINLITALNKGIES